MMYVEDCSHTDMAVDPDNGELYCQICGWIIDKPDDDEGGIGELIY